MLDPPIRCLLVEDDEDDYFLVRELLSDLGNERYSIDWVRDYTSGWEEIRSGDHHVCMIDYQIGAMTGVDFIRSAHAQGCLTPMILLTGVGTGEIDVAASQAGAHDFLEKEELTPRVLERAIRYAVTHAEQRRALEHRTALLRATLQHTGAGIAAFNGNLELETYNSQLIEFLEIPGGPEEWSDETVDEETRRRLSRLVWDQLKLIESPQTVMFEVEAPLGRTIEVRHNVAPGGRRVIVCIDITERKSTERDLLASRQAALAASSAKSEFLANASHELRTPLNAVIGFASMMADEVLGPIGNAKYASYAKLIRDSGGILLEMINDLLDLSKIEAGKYAMNETVVDLETLIVECMEHLSVLAQERRIAIHFECNYVDQLWADERAVRHAVLNLVSNALKFSEEDGEVRIRTRASPNGSPAIVVEDDGIGMSELELIRCLEPFGQVNSSLARKYEGTGLGLPLVMKYAEMHGGALSINSTKGAGTEATILFPPVRQIQRGKPRSREVA